MSDAGSGSFVASGVLSGSGTITLPGSGSFTASPQLQGQGDVVMIPLWVSPYGLLAANVLTMEGE